jgi:hypothetical protein
VDRGGVGKPVGEADQPTRSFQKRTSVLEWEYLFALFVVRKY